MTISPSKFNKFLLFKLPSAYLAGVRVKELDAVYCDVSVKHRWINQNPFNSMFWAVQGMAAELATGALVSLYVRNANTPISMLVLNNKASFSKKAKGRITFRCDEGLKVKDTVEKALGSMMGQTIWLNAIGIDEQGDEVSNFSFEWTLKVKS